MNYERIVRRIRNSDKLWSEDDKIADKASRVLKKAKEKMIAERIRTAPEPKRGPYSGMTREELAQTGTVETDWY